MAGHSKWANIKHRKGKQDAKRSKIFTKLIRELTVAARAGGDDITANPRLRLAVDNALSNNMTRDTINRAIKRGVGGDDGEVLEELRYEGYGPGGVAVMVDCLTNNNNRTVSEVRHAFSKHGGNLGTDGSVAYMFNKQGYLTFATGVDGDKVLDIALGAEAEDVINHIDGSVEVITTPENFLQVKETMAAADLLPENSEVTMIPANTIDITDVETAEKFMKLIDALEELDDVQQVYSNAEIDDSILEKLN